MGRWSQRRLRGTNAGASPPPAATAMVTNVAAIGMSTYAVTFNQPVDFIDGVNFGLGFTISTQGVTNVPTGQTNPGNVVNVEIAGSAWGTGDPWDLSGQPNWLVTPALTGFGTLS